jgi:photosystem II stability/assembly factor-like uncharacterized protein
MFPRLNLEALEVREVLSSSIPLSDSAWTALGPAPLTQGSTNYAPDTSGRIVGIAAHPTDPNTIYVAAAGGGVWKTTDGGNSWTPLTDNQATLFMGAIAVAPGDPGTVYAGTGEANDGPSKTRLARTNIFYGRGVLQSADAGDSWNLEAGNPGQKEFDRRTISKIVVDPGDSSTVYVAIGAVATNGLAGNTGIWKSTDGGQTWTNTMASISTTDAYSDVIMNPADSQTLYAAVGTPGGSTKNGIYKTTNGGASWALAGDFPTGQSNPKVGRISLSISPAGVQTVYASVATSGLGGTSAGKLLGIYKTTDAGSHWTPSTTAPDYMASAGDYMNALAVDPADANIVYAGGETLLATKDGGATWTTIADGEETRPHHDNHALAFDANGKLLVGNDGGIWRLESLDTLTWTDLNTNLQITQFIDMALNPSSADIVYGGTQDNGVVKFQDDYAWSRLTRGDGGAVLVSPTSPTTVYHIVRGSTFYNSHFFRRSTNGGDTWTTKLNGIDLADPKNMYPPVVMDPADSSRLLLGTNRVYETTDRGDNWTARSTPGSGGWVGSDRIDALAVAPTNVNRIYASAGGHIFTTANRGTTWTNVSIPGGDDHIAVLVVNEVNSQIVYAVRDRFGGGHVFRSDDAGKTWNDISGDLPAIPVNTLVLDRRFSPRRLYIGTDTGVYASDNGGRNWYVLSDGLPNAQVVKLELNTTLNILAAATHGRGMWELIVNGPPVPAPAPGDPETDAGVVEAVLWAASPCAGWAGFFPGEHRAEDSGSRDRDVLGGLPNHLLDVARALPGDLAERQPPGRSGVGALDALDRMFAEALP